MPWRSRRYDRTSVPDIRHSTVGQFAPIAAVHEPNGLARKQNFVQVAFPTTGRPSTGSPKKRS